MEGKKKKNRKKKGNQSNSAAAAAPPNGEEAVEREPSRGSPEEQDHGDQAPVAAPGRESETHREHEPNHESPPEQNRHKDARPTDTRSVGVSESEVEVDGHNICEARWIKLQEDVRRLGEEKSLWLEKEAISEEKIRVLREAVESCTLKEAILEEKVKDLLAANDSSLQKQVLLEEKVNHIEGIENSLSLREMSTREMITRLDDVNIGLQVQVSELKESRDSLFQENYQLKESIALLESRVQHLEMEASVRESSVVKITELPEEKNLIYQVEAAHEPVKHLNVDNAVLEKVAHEFHEEKANEVHIEPDLHALGTSHAELDHATTSMRASPSNDYASTYSENYQTFERIHESFGIHNSPADYGSVARARQGQLTELYGSRISSDVVSVPLDDIQVQDTELQAARPDESVVAQANPQPLPLSDAPLIGAPFRLISYFAKYVSGADLANQNRSSSG